LAKQTTESKTMNTADLRWKFMQDKAEQSINIIASSTDSTFYGHSAVDMLVALKALDELERSVMGMLDTIESEMKE
jgi:hypothetical protein